jgi:Cysteine dioxygenase type I
MAAWPWPSSSTGPAEGRAGAADPGRRTFHPLRRDPDVTVWLICWMPGHDTGFHDHDGAAGAVAAGAVAVARGRVVEERLRLDGPRPVHFGPGEVLEFGPATSIAWPTPPARRR